MYRLQAREGEESQEEDESLLDLISGYGKKADAKGEAAGTKDEAKSSGKGKGGQK